MSPGWTQRSREGSRRPALEGHLHLRRLAPSWHRADQAEVTPDEQSGCPGYQLPPGRIGQFGPPDHWAVQARQPVVLARLDLIMAMDEVDQDEMGLLSRGVFPVRVAVQTLLQPLVFDLFWQRLFLHDFDLRQFAEGRLKFVVQLRRTCSLKTGVNRRCSAMCRTTCNW